MNTIMVGRKSFQSLLVVVLSSTIQGQGQLAVCPPSLLDCTQFMYSVLKDDQGRCLSEVTLGAREAGLPWVLDPVHLPCSNQKIHLDADVVLEAKRGEFTAKSDCLITLDSLTNVTIDGGEGATLKMWREDYANASLYNHSEWRHAVVLRGVDSVSLVGLTIMESGGDGIYIANTFKPGNADCRNVIIQNVQAVRNYRQGMSVIGVEGLTVTDTVFGYTNGTAPMAGVDFEPNADTNHLSSIRFDNVTVVGNSGRGFQLSLHSMNLSSTPIDIEIRNSAVLSSGLFGLSVGGPSSVLPKGSHVLFSNMTVANTGEAGILVESKGINMPVVFENVTVSAVYKEANAPVWIEGRAPGSNTGGVVFTNVIVADDVSRPCVQFLGDVSHVTGMIVETNTKSCVKTDVPMNNDVTVKCSSNFGADNASSNAVASNRQRQGFVGVYHSATGNVADGHNTSAYDVGTWGMVAQENAPEDGGVSFKDNLDFQCNHAKMNAVYGMLIAASEGGTFSNPNDTDVFNPLPLTKRGDQPGPQGSAGLLQGAARWSTLARTFCPQIAGVVIDDFWSNYENSNAPRPSPPPPGMPCPKCPSTQPHIYGNDGAGYYCCKWNATSHCQAPAGSPPVAKPNCCLLPGGTAGCQDVPRCGVNPNNTLPCGHSKSDQLSLYEMQQIKGALMGHTLDEDGTVDMLSPALTPWLKLFVVTYDEQIPLFVNQSLYTEGVVDGASFWISGPKQDTMFQDLGELVASFRKIVGPDFPIFAGGYLTYSSIGWMNPYPFYGLLEQSIQLYSAHEIQGFYIFAGDVLSTMNASLWKQWNLNTTLSPYQARLGSASIDIVDASTKTPLSVAVVCTVTFANTHITRRNLIPSASPLDIDGWPGSYTVQLVAKGYAPTNYTDQIQGAADTKWEIPMKKNSV